jgi:hypothetical protein
MCDNLIVTMGVIGEKFCKFCNCEMCFFAECAMGGLDNCGKEPKKPILAQQFPVFAAAGGGAAADEGELLRHGRKAVKSEKLKGQRKRQYKTPDPFASI